MDVAKQGYVLEHSEWHHATFDLGADGSAKSDVSMKLFIPTTSILQERIAVERHACTSPGPRTWIGNGLHIPGHIDARDLTMIVHHGPDAFTEALSIDSKTLGQGANSSLSPVLVYDINGDGLDDIILPSMNIAFINHSTPGNIAFTRTNLCEYPITDNSMNPGPSISTAVLADVNGDGVADLIVAGPGLVPTVYIADPHGKFPWPGRPCCDSLRNDDFRAPFCITVGDVNGDGKPDLWIGQYRPPYADGNVPKTYWDANDGYPSFLLDQQWRWDIP